MNLPVSDGFSTPEQELKPTWRGWIHTGVLPLVIAAGVVLIVLADGWVAKTGSAIFFACSFLLFGNSALYHRFNWRPRVKKALKRIDHANIFLLIAGTYTPLTMLALPKDTGLMLLIGIWVVAFLGIGFRVFWITAPRWLYVPIYLAMGWVALGFIGEFLDVNIAMMVLVLCGGAAYSLGAVVYGFKKPNPWPGHFGFHEIFHALTVVAFLCHWTAVLLVALAPAANSLGG